MLAFIPNEDKILKKKITEKYEKSTLYDLQWSLRPYFIYYKIFINIGAKCNLQGKNLRLRAERFIKTRTVIEKT